MGKIKLLSENIIHKIAAGEVIERPASVVKELVENSIDAQSTTIRIEVEGGGKQSIIIADDGTGMNSEDVRLCIQRHATSKMSSPSDLFAISTLGFRGEAMASIGAVSRMSIETRVREENEGTRLFVEGGILGEILSFGRGKGTTIRVRNLFFNTPARRKFLRHVDTEARHITQTITQLSAAYPEISFELIHQDRQILQLKAASRVERARDLLGVSNPIVVNFEEGGICIEGIVSTPEECGKSKGKQYIVVRGRPIVSAVLNKAIYRGYGGVLPQGLHPSYIVWIDIDPSMIDVNVHPTKREIRFADEIVFVQILEKAIRQSLEIPEAKGFSYRQEAIAPFVPKLSEETSDFTWGSRGADRQYQQTPSLKEEGEGKGVEQGALALTVSPVEKKGGVRQAIDVVQTSPVYYRQIHKKYILIDIDDGIALIDQQVAHERIRYEEALRYLKGTVIEVQQLLIPVTLQLNRAEMELVKENRRFFASLGFGVREFSSNTIVVDAVPAALEDWNDGQVFYEIVNELLDDNVHEIEKFEDRLARTFARRTAIRRGQDLTVDEMKVIVHELFAAQESFVGPDGKMAIIKITVKELDKMFST